MVVAILLVLFGCYSKNSMTNKENFDSWTEGELRCVLHGYNCPNMHWMQ
jgi:hypothetical protein